MNNNNNYNNNNNNNRVFTYSINFPCVQRYNAQKRCIVFIMNRLRNCTYKISKLFIKKGKS